MTCRPESDRLLGPQVDPNCRGFDFTLKFEDVFFACVPAAVFLLLAPSQLLRVSRKPATSSPRSKVLLVAKLITLIGLLLVQVVFLTLRVRNPIFRSDVSITADVLVLVATGIAVLLSTATHERSLRPSTLLSIYLSVSVLLTSVRTRTTWLLVSDSAEAVTITIICALTAVALLLESIEDWRGKVAAAPEQLSGFWSRASFAWLLPTLWIGRAKVISVQDLPPLDTRLKSQVLHAQLLATWSKYDHRDRHSLLRASFKSCLPTLLSAIVPRLFLAAFTFAQPALIETTINLVGSRNANNNHGKGLIGAWALVYLGLAMSHSLTRYQTLRFTTRLRGSLIALTYQRSLVIRPFDAGEITAISLMGTDIERIASGMSMFHEVWGSLLEIGIACWLLERQVYLASFAPILLVLVFVGATSRLSVASGAAQRQWIEKVQERLRITSNLLGDIKAIKMLGLSRIVSNTLHTLRMDEIKASSSFRKLLVATILFSLTPINLAPVVTLATYVIISVFWTNDSLLTAKAFTSLTLITLLTTPVIIFIQSLPMVIQCVSSFDRIQEFYNYGTDVDVYTDQEPNNNEGSSGQAADPLRSEPASASDYSTPNNAITLHNQSFSFDKESSATLKNIDLSIEKGALVVIVGAVGSGKSALLNVLLGEMAMVASGSGPKTNPARVSAPVAYCSQSPWLENTSVRKNIVATSQYDRDWYDAVIKSCGLASDFEQLANGDQTQIGSTGLVLSGGQKQRIALARAVYAKRSIMLLDDVFSGMDAQTAESVAKGLFGRDGLLRKSNTTVVLTTHNRQIIALADSAIALQDGRIIETTHKLEGLVQEGNNLGLLPDEIAAEETSENKPDAKHEPVPVRPNPGEEQDSAMPHTDIRRKQGDASVYTYYLSNAGWLAVGFYCIFVVLWIAFTEFSVVWVKWWSAANSDKPNQNVWMYLGVYALFGVLGVASASITAWVAFVSIISNSAARLHSILVQTTLRTTFRFLATTDSGELLNRFSTDMELIDMELPASLLNWTSTVVSCLAKIVILAIFSRYLGVTIPFFAITIYFLQHFYLQTSRQLRLLATEAQAPLFTHFNETATGAPTIRAFGWYTFYEERTFRLTDESQRPLYIQNCIQHWLGFVLELIVTVLATVLVATVVIWRERFDAGSVGVSLVTVVAFGEILVRLIQTWTKVEPSLGAISRIKWFVADSEPERIVEKGPLVTQQWPEAGAIEFKNVVATYGSSPTATPVLKTISLSIPSAQHIAILGRTGSGKTSLALALLQMLPTTSGQITIDGHDLASLDPELIRARIIVLSQDAFLLPGTVRLNVDPYDEATEEQIVNALDRVKLWERVKEKGGLDATLNAADWSVGQRQLFCYARAIAKKSRCRVLVLDEAMSSVDVETEALMQTIIDADFVDCTVLHIMHRLEHLRAYDRAVLLDRGEIIESGDPKVLLDQEDGSRIKGLWKIGGTE